MKVIVITGGSRGLGLAIARACLQAGAQVVVASRSGAAVEGASAFTCDVGNEEDVRRLAAFALEKFGRIDGWVNNAGVGGAYGPTASVPVDRFVSTVQTNVLGTYFGSRAALEAMLPNKRGVIVNLLGRGDKSAVPFQSGYAASKAWIRSFTKSLQKEYSDSGVSIHAINPGLVDTELLRAPEVVEGYEAKLSAMPTLIRMWARPPEVAAREVVKLLEGGPSREVQVMGAGFMLISALRELFRRLSGNRADASSVKPTIVKGTPRHVER